MNLYFLVAGLIDLTGVVVHGGIGHRLILTPLTTERLFPTRAFGSAEMTRRVLILTWHAVTATFGAFAVMMFLLAFGIVQSSSVALFLSAVRVSFLLLGLSVTGWKFRLLSRPIPLLFVTGTITAALMGWLGASRGGV